MEYTLKHIQHKDIDFKKWDKTVLNSEIPYVFAQSFYLNATCPNWDALIIGNYDSIFPLPAKKKYGYAYLPQPPFTSQLGVYGKANSEIEQVFYNYIIKQFKLIELELNSFNHIKSNAIKSKKTHLINYKNGFTYNQNTKRNITKATKSGFTVEQIQTEDILTLSKKYLNPFLLSELKLPKKHTVLFNNLIKNSLTHNSIISFQTVNSSNKIIAIAHFIYNKKYVLFLKGTNFDKAENSGSMHLLINHAISYFTNKCMYFDFGGGSLNEGLANFYKGLGGAELRYSFLKINNLPSLIKIFKK